LSANAKDALTGVLTAADSSNSWPWRFLRGWNPPDSQSGMASSFGSAPSISALPIKGWQEGRTMGDMFEISPAMRRHMQAQSEALIAANPAKYLTGPYRVAPEAPRPVRVPVVEVPVEPVVPVEAPEGDLPPLKPPPKHARDYLRRRLSGRVEVPATVLFKDAATHGFSVKSLRTAKNTLTIRVFQQDRVWWWLLTEVT
jgi:hypothetical protein